MKLVTACSQLSLSYSNVSTISGTSLCWFISTLTPFSTYQQHLYGDELVVLQRGTWSNVFSVKANSPLSANEVLGKFTDDSATRLPLWKRTFRISKLSQTTMNKGLTSRYSGILSEINQPHRAVFSLWEHISIAIIAPFQCRRRPQQRATGLLIRETSSVSKPIPEEGRSRSFYMPSKSTIKRCSDTYTRTASLRSRLHKFKICSLGPGSTDNWQ